MPTNEHTLHSLFRVSLWLKAAHSLLEIAAGILLVFASHALIIELAQALTAAELLEDPNDYVANAVRGFATSFSTSSQSFAAYYLLSHGAIKLAAVAGVLLNHRWAYPGFIGVLAGFIAYQLYRLSLGVTWGLLAITALDGLVLVLAFHEYRIVRSASLR